jgi:5-methylcytosine-specific restriction endonuclease McrA
LLSGIVANIRRKKVRRSVEYEVLDKKSKLETYLRDNGLCAVCSEIAWEVHEIIPRREWGKSKLNELFLLKNRISVCRKCHTEVKREEFLTILKERHGYDYNMSPWIKYITKEILKEQDTNG